MGGGDDQARKDLQKGRREALKELSRIYEGPLEGLRLAPEFFKLAGSPELAGTPVGKGYELQNSILDQLQAALNGQGYGQGAGALPADMRSAILESEGQDQASAGIFGSGIGDLGLANRFAGASESLRQSRIASALAGLAGTSAQAGVLPGASQFLGVGAQRALAAANVNTETFGAEAKYSAEAAARESQAYSSLLGFGLSAATGGLAGGLGGLGGLGISKEGGWGTAGQGALAFTGLAPYGSFGQGGGQGDLDMLLARLGLNRQSLSSYLSAATTYGGR